MNVQLRATLLLCSLVALGGVVGCEEETPGGDTTPPQPPVISSLSDTILLPDSLIMLRGQATDANGDALTYEWFVDSADTFVVLRAQDTSWKAPSTFDLDLRCILRVTDATGLLSSDTMVALVTWLRSPNGGEVFYVGDTLTIEMIPFYNTVSPRLVIELANETILLALPGLSGIIVPMERPILKFAIPDSMTATGFGRIGLVSDSCRIRIQRYSDQNYYIDSKDFFSIRPRR